MGGGLCRERIGEAAEEARSRAKAAEDSPATGSGRLTAPQRAEDDELPCPAIDLAVAPVAPIDEIGFRWQGLLTPGPLVSDRRRPGGEGGISGDVAPGGFGPDAPARYICWSSTAGFHPGRTNDCNQPSRILDSPISSGCIRGSGGFVASRKQAPGLPEVFHDVEGWESAAGTTAGKAGSPTP
jgi:hypothetical protein